MGWFTGPTLTKSDIALALDRPLTPGTRFVLNSALWADIMDFEVIPVITSAGAQRAVVPRL
jgi:hypothetical protein